MLKLTIDATLRGAGKVTVVLPLDAEIVVSKNVVQYLSKDKVTYQDWEIKKTDKVTIERL